MRLDFEKVSMRNFLSVGNAPQTVILNKDGLTLVLGENLDTGGVNSRNGVGKSTILQAVSFALFGLPLSNIKRDNLINSINGKNMVVSFEFRDAHRSYRIERGRKPAFLRYYVNDGLVNEEGTDEGQGENKNTQAEIEKILGFSHDMFRHIIAMNTYTDPFLKMRPGDQRVLIEELLGITSISARSDSLKELVKSTKDTIKEEEFRLKAQIESNGAIQRAIDDLKNKCLSWDVQKEQRISSSTEALEGLQELDIDSEVEAHTNLATFREVKSQLAIANRDRVRMSKELNMRTSSFERLLGQLTDVQNHKCHTCGMDIHDASHEKLLTDITNQVAKLEEEILALGADIESNDAEIVILDEALAAIGEEPQIIYPTLEEALGHRNTIQNILNDLERERASENPYTYQISHLEESGIQDVSYENLNEMNTLLKHQDFLLKLLTSKDSFIRKKIIEQNINHLNHRLNFYLEKLNLPHEVTFKSDLGVEITLLGRDFDFEQLSRGEMNRLILSTGWAFRDVWESLNHPVNLLFVDEMLDSGIDAQGSEAALDILKKTARERHKNIFLISHKEELIGRVSKILHVKKENGFTTIGSQDDVE